MWEFIVENKEWFLSGIGVVVILSLSNTLLAGLKKIWLYINTRKIPIYIQINSTSLNQFSDFSLLHVERGGYPANKTIINIERKFKRVDKKGTLRVYVPCLIRRGFVFKCFIDYTNLTFEEVKSELEKEGYTEISKGDGITLRAFFILPEYYVNRRLRFINNEFLPS